MNRTIAKKMGDLRGRKKDKAYKKLSKRKVRYKRVLVELTEKG
jgi:hypothetical protein